MLHEYGMLHEYYMNTGCYMNTASIGCCRWTQCACGNRGSALVLCSLVYCSVVQCTHICTPVAHHPRVTLDLRGAGRCSEAERCGQEEHRERGRQGEEEEEQEEEEEEEEEEGLFKADAVN